MDYQRLLEVISKLVPPNMSLLGGGPLSWGDGRPDNSPDSFLALQSELKKAQAAKAAQAHPQAPQAPQFNPFGPPTLPHTAAPVPAGLTPGSAMPQTLPTQPMPPVQALDLPMAPSVPQPTPAPAQTPQAAVPMPQARPASAPQASEPMSFFQRNSAMMRDPSSGDFLDPAAAQRASASGPDLIQKFMDYFHNKA